MRKKSNISLAAMPLGKKITALALAAAIMLSAVGCAANVKASEGEDPQDSQNDAEVMNEPDLTDESEEPQEPEVPEIPPYDFTQSVPESEAVEDSYFDDAVFIGNSRTEGFMLYAGLSNATYFTAVGLMVDTIFTEPYAQVDGEKMTIIDALKTKEFSKVYIMLGMNELGWVYGSVYQEYYGRIIDTIREINPDAVIYIQSILPVSSEKSEKDKIYNNPRILEFNALLHQLAEEKEVYYINVAEAVSDENGCLPEGASFDGVHLTPEYCGKWREYLKTHTITTDTVESVIS